MTSFFEKIGEFFLDYIGRVLRNRFFGRKKLSDVNILFIDDEHSEFSIIKTLDGSREYGRVDGIADLDNLENPFLKQSDIVFLDIQWIGKKMGVPNGTSLVDSIRSYYPDKIITIYSSKGIPKNSHIKAGISTIPKNASYEVFRSHIQALWDAKK